MKFYRSWQGIDALSFDLDDTLYDNYPVIKAAEKKLLAWLINKLPSLLAFTQKDWQGLQHEVILADPSLQHHVTEKRKAQLTLAITRCGLSPSAAENMANDALDYFLYERSNFCVPTSVFELLTSLAKRYPLVAITNGNVDCDKLGLAPYFSQILRAGFDGQAKPHADMFDQARHFLDLPAGRILHVGDNLCSDVAGAKKAGFKACWLNTKACHYVAKENAFLLPDMEISRIEELMKL